MNSTYSSAGVNISEGDKFVDKIKSLVKTTFTENVHSGIGNFGAFFKVPKGFKEPIFVASTDGVGTKIKVAISMRNYDTIGEDIVNHSVNDIAVCGASPLFFLDYLAFGKLKSEIAVDIVKGMVRGCRKNNCALIGGETAEMPGMYAEKDFDIAGTIIGAVEKKNIIDKKNVKPGDVLIGLKSNGLHTNGYSLVRKVFNDRFNRRYEGLSLTLGDELLKVHKSYLNIIQSLIKKFKIHSISHITGGGIEGNTKRVIPKDIKLNINWTSWDRNPVFDIIQRTGKIAEKEMRKVFNLGIGLVLIVSKNDADKIAGFLKNKKEKYYIIGETVSK
jgi:phosphoribosylformylglycinamidine cyclo-ligase